MSAAKSLTRIYFPGEIAAHGQCTLAPEQVHHVVRVLRLGVGDTVTLFDGRGVEYNAEVARIGKAVVTLNVGEPRQIDRESHIAVTLAQAVSSGDRMDFTVQKAVELGVACIQPLASERTVVRLQHERAQKRVAHWQSIAISACEQCGRNLVPRVLPVMEFTSWLDEEKRDLPRLRVLLSPSASTTLRELPRPSVAVSLLAGPEGGLSLAEERDALAAKFTAVRLGPRILRTETAAVAALAAMQALWGDF